MRDVHDIARLGLLQYAGADDLQYAGADERYVPLEYLESTGGQYIDTGVGFSPTDELEMTGSSASLGNDSYLVAPSSWNTDVNRFALLGKMNNFVSFGFGSWTTGLTHYSPRTAWDGTAVYTATYANRTFRCGELTGDATGPAFGSDTTELYLFYGYNKPTPCRIYRYRHVKAGVLVRDLVPMLRVRDGKPGMYDRVHSRFYVNKGTGEFKHGGYVTDGLVLWLDAISNKRNGYDANAQTWDNLVSGESYAFARGNAMEWEDDCLVMPGTVGAAIDVGFLGKPQDFTFEVVFMRSEWKNQATCFSCTESGGVGWQATTVSYERPLIARKDIGYYPYPSDAIHDTSLSRHYKALTASVADGKCMEYIGGDVAQPAIAEAYTGTRYYQLAFNLGTDATGGASNAATLLGHYCVCRVYNRALTSEEIAHNYAVDRLRFNLA